MRKKASLIAVIFFLLAHTIVSGIGIPHTATAKGLSKGFLTDVNLTDEKGNDINAEHQTNVESAVKVTYDWTLKDLDVNEGDTYSFSLPKMLKVQNQQGSLTASGTKVGTFQVANGTVTLTFNEEAANKDNAGGKLTIGAAFNKEAIGDKEKVSIPFALSGTEKVINVSFEVDSEEESEEEQKEENEADEKANEKGTDEKVDKKDNKKAENDETAKIADTDSKESDEKDEVTAETGETTKAEEDPEKESAEDNEPKEIAGEMKQASNGEKHGFKLNLGDVTDLEGNSYSEENLLDPKDEFRLKLDWHLENGHNYVAGDTETFKLPKGIKITEKMTGELKDAFGSVVATYEITTDKKVELTFTDFVKTHSNVQGWLEIISTLDEREVEVEDGEAILDPIGEEKEIRIPIKQGNKEKTIEKKGTPNKGYNADEINWEVIINKNKTSLKDTKITDALPEGTEYKEKSLKVTKLKTALNGDIIGEEEIDVTDEKVEEGVLTIPLGDIKDAYRIEYVTTVTNDEKKDFKNNATLSDNELEDVSANATATINRGEAIKKKAAKSYNPKTGIIEWEIEFNYNQKKLENVTLKDAWTPEGKMHLVEGSLRFQEVTIDEKGNANAKGDPVELPEGAKLESGKDQFEVTGISTDKAYKVTYQTKVNDRVLDPFEVANTAGFGTESVGSGTGVGTYYGSKSAGTIDYQNKTIDWKIEINHDEYPMEKISITDTLGAGLTLIENSLNVTVDGEKYTDFTFVDGNPFEIKFPDNYLTKKKIEITYQTKFVADKVPNQKPTNKADITWTPGGGGDSITKEVEAETELNDNTKNNHWKNGSYNSETKEITWTIYTNYRENQIDDLIITDAPKGNQKIVSDSVVITELAIDEDGNITDGKTLADVALIAEDKKSLIVNIGETNKAYKIEYKTSLAGLSDIQKEYVNKAEVFDGDKSLSKLHATVGIAKSDTYGEKSGYQDGKQVHWSVKVNLGQQKINNLKLEDTISENQEYLEGTIKVYHATVDENGNATKGEEVSAGEYVLTHTPGEPTFTVEWKEAVERAFIVEYSTLFFEKHNGEVTNTYKVTGDNLIENGKTGDTGRVTIKQLSSGGASGVAGYLVIDKVDTTYDETNNKSPGLEEAPKLEGVKFELIDADTNKVLKTGTTNENGKIDFGRLLYGDYIVKEIGIPKNYVAPKKEERITINTEYKSDDENTKYVYTAENYQPVYMIELTKTNAHNRTEVVPGAEYTIFKDVQINEGVVEGVDPIATKITDSNGKIIFDLEDYKLKEGTYYVKETKAPDYFEIDKTFHKVTIGKEEKVPKQLNVTDKEIVDITVTKVWNDDENTDDYRPSAIEVELFRTNSEGDKRSIDKKELTSTDNWKHTFTDLDKYDEDGDPFKYEIVENNVDATKYKVEVEERNEHNFFITNTRIGTTSVEVTKTWKSDRVENRPDKITVNLLQNGSVIDSKEITPIDNKWGYTFTNLEKYDSEGKLYSYSVKEERVPGYTSKVTGNQADGFVITNTKFFPPPPVEPEKTNVSVEKVWKGEKQDSATVNLLADGKKVDSVDLSEENGWKHTFSDLPVIQNGKAIAYTVEEVAIDNYKTTIAGNQKDGYVITNLQVGTTEVSGTKTWKDDNPAERPDTIKVNLLQNGVVVDTKNVTVKNGWKYSFTDLAKYDENGAAYKYTVKEHGVPGYKSEVKGYDITNIRSDKTSVVVTKGWKDDTLKERPDKITVKLLRNGKVFDRAEVTAVDDWTYEFAGLEAYDSEGAAYVYTVEEEAVEGYKAIINGYDITNVLLKEPEEPKKPEEPGKPTPGEPNDPGEPNKPGDPNDSGQPNAPGQTDKPARPVAPISPAAPSKPVSGGQGGEGNLPKTATAMFNYGLIGMTALIAGLLARKRRK